MISIFKQNLIISRKDHIVYQLQEDLSQYKSKKRKYFLKYLFIFYCCQLQLSLFFPPLLSPARPTPAPKDNPLPIVLFFLFFIVVQVHFSPLPPPTTPHSPATVTSHLQSYPPLALSMGPLQAFLDNTSPFSPITLSLFPSGHCQFVLNLNVSGCILLACWFC